MYRMFDAKERLKAAARIELFLLALLIKPRKMLVAPISTALAEKMRRYCVAAFGLASARRQGNEFLSPFVQKRAATRELV